MDKKVAAFLSPATKQLERERKGKRREESEELPFSFFAARTSERDGDRKRASERERDETTMNSTTLGSGRTLTGLSSASRRVSAARPTRQVTAMAKKGKMTRVVITLECTEQKGSGVPGMSRYMTTKVSDKKKKKKNHETLACV